MRFVSLWLRPSFFALLTALLILFNSILSVTLTYVWQSAWRKIDRPPFISDAHYDDHQSPIFATMTTLTATSAAYTVILTWMITQERARKQPNVAATTCFGTGRGCRSLVFPILLRGRLQRVAAMVALASGLFAAVCLVLAAAVTAKNGLHFVAIAMSFGANVIWAFAVSVTLESAAGDHLEGEPHRICVFFMQVCVLLLAGSVIALVVMHSREHFFGAAILEYVIVVTVSVFLVLLAFRLGLSRVISTPMDDASRIASTIASEESGDEAIDLEMLVR